MNHHPGYGIAAAGLLAAVALTACSGSSGDASSSAPPSGPSAPASGAPGAPGQPGPSGPTRNPLTGGKLTNNGVVAVKIDDTSNGRPQMNIDKADVVYIEQVEGGLTRLLAIYNSDLPTVEAVRSTRASDPELVEQYGHIAYVASGGAYNPLKVLDASPLKTSINDRGGPGFQRDGSRYAPYNLRADLAAVANRLKAPRNKPVGFHWAWDDPQLKGQPGGLHVRTEVGSTPVAFDYYAKSRHYHRIIAGQVQKTASGKTISAANIMLQFCNVTTYAKDTDVNGNPSKWTHSVGHGTAVLFREGKRITGTWHRSSNGTGTRFLTKDGHNMLLRPGQLWVVLVANGAHYQH